MNNSVAFGLMNEHAVGALMKVMVQLAMQEIRNQRFSFEVQEKTNLSGKADFVTSADKAAQAMYVRKLKECFPGYGIIAEEAELQEPCTIDGIDLYFTVDPLDGTRAFTRYQSHGIGTMISLIRNGEIIAAYVGDPLTGEIYGYRPESIHVNRITATQGWPLAIDATFPLKKQAIVLRELPDEYLQVYEKLVRRPERGGLFNKCEITSGSIGTSVARLWKGEVGAMVFMPGLETPWDVCPVKGISEKMGFRYLAWDIGEKNFLPYDLPVSKTPVERSVEVILVHKSRINELQFWACDTFRK